MTKDKNNTPAPAADTKNTPAQNGGNAQNKNNNNQNNSCYCAEYLWTQSTKKNFFDPTKQFSLGRREL